MKNIMNGKVAAGLIAASSLWSVWDVMANTLNQSKEKISKVLVVDKEGKGNTEDKKTIDFQQARKSWEVKKSPETKNIAGENLILDEQGVEEYFAQHGTVPYLSNGATIDGEKIINSWVWNESYCYFYLSNNDSVILDVSNIDHFDSEWWCEDIWGGKIKITWHAVITIHKGGTYTHVTINNGANFVKQWEEKIVEQADTFHIVKNLPEGTKLPKEFIEQVFWKVVSFDNETKFWIPLNRNNINLRYKGKFQESWPWWIESDWKMLDKENLWSWTGNFWTIQELESLGGNSPYKTTETKSIKIGNKEYTYKLEYSSIKPLAYDWGTSAVQIWDWRNIGNSVNTIVLHIIKIQEIAEYGEINEGYDSTQIEAPKYYDDVGKEVAKDSLELGKTYQLKVQAKRDYKITSVIVNEEEYTPTEEGSFTINFEVKENNKIEIKSASTSGIEWTEVKEPRISSENGTLTIDTQDTPLQSVQIYDLKGQLIAQKSKPEWVENFHLSEGLYFVNWRTAKGEWKTVKIMVK